MAPPECDLSFVVPVYGSPESLPLLAARIKSVCAEMGSAYELILVDDRCPRGSWSVVKELSSQDRAVVGVRLSRNFGQHAAIQAGLSLSHGTWIVVMDCDLQDLPEEVPALLAKASEGWDIVQARRGARTSDPLVRRLMSKLFYKALSFLTDTDQNAEIANFGAYSRKVIDAILCWDEETKYFPATVQWVGFSRTGVDVRHGSRHEGRSSYTLGKLIQLALNVVIGFSERPIRLLVGVGLAMAVAGFVLSIVVVALNIAGVVEVQGWTSLMLSVWFLAGCLLFSIGLTGLYVGRILSETKRRPKFIVDEAIGLGLPGLPSLGEERRTERAGRPVMAASLRAPGITMP